MSCAAQGGPDADFCSHQHQQWRAPAGVSQDASWALPNGKTEHPQWLVHGKLPPPVGKS